MKGFIKTWWQGENKECTYCKNGCYFTGDRCSCTCHTPQSVEKELRLCPKCNTMKNMEFGTTECRQCFVYLFDTSIPQSTTLGTTMEERLIEAIKEADICYGWDKYDETDDTHEKPRLIHENDMLMSEIIEAILPVLSQSKAETIKEIRRKITSIYIEQEKDQSGRIVSSEEYEFTPYSKGFNQALKTLSDLLSKDIEQ